MKICLRCGKAFEIKPKGQAKKYCSAKCSDAAQWEKRKKGLTGLKKINPYISTEFFDWREYPDTILI